MRSAVQDAVFTFLAEFEGDLSYMYLDELGLVTTAIGCKVDPLADALAVDWIIPGRGPATTEEVTSSWEAVKAATSLAPDGGVIFHTVPGNVVRLTAASESSLVQKRLTGFEANLVERFPAFESFCADAQLALISMEWGMGDFNARFPRFAAAVNQNPPDWLTAAIQSHESNGAPARNEANYTLLVNAAVVDADDMNPDVLCWPAKLTA
jgi:hypothetical protein